jgi:hypothetical protein
MKVSLLPQAIGAVEKWESLLLGFPLFHGPQFKFVFVFCVLNIYVLVFGCRV